MLHLSHEIRKWRGLVKNWAPFCLVSKKCLNTQANAVLAEWREEDVELESNLECKHMSLDFQLNTQNT